MSLRNYFGTIFTSTGATILITASVSTSIYLNNTIQYYKLRVIENDINNTEKVHKYKSKVY